MRWIDGWIGVAGVLVLASPGADSAGSDADISLPTAEATVAVDQREVTTLPETSTSTSTTDGGTPTTESSIESALVEGGFDVCAALDTVDLDGLLGEPAGLPEPEDNRFGAVCAVPSLNPESQAWSRSG